MPKELPFRGRTLVTWATPGSGAIAMKILDPENPGGNKFWIFLDHPGLIGMIQLMILGKNILDEKN